jgi:hypothetical protein
MWGALTVLEPALAVAVEEIAEENFNGAEHFVHAQRGDVGVIHEVDGEWANVTWNRTGTTTVCHESQFAPVPV